jgi:hypothetical protein
MPTSAIQSDLEAIMSRQQARLAERPAEETAPGARYDDNKAPESSPTEIKQQPLMRPPAPAPHMLNQEMAEAAAKKFKKKEKRIQRACAALDAGEPLPPRQAACCVIL